jgi:hypothetical protein
MHNRQGLAAYMMASKALDTWIREPSDGICQVPLGLLPSVADHHSQMSTRNVFPEIHKATNQQPQAVEQKSLQTHLGLPPVPRLERLPPISYGQWC